MAVPYRIKGPTAAFLIGTAVLFDGIQFLLTLTVVGSLFSFLVTAVAWILFAFLFLINGVSIFDQGAAKKALIAIGSVVTEVMPVINALPALTLGVVALIAQSRTEDMKKQKGASMDHAKARAALKMARMRQERSQLIAAGRVARQARGEEEGS